MSNKLSKEKAEALASLFLTNGYNKKQALLDMGYSPSYAVAGQGFKLYDNPLVKAAINKLQVNLQAKTAIDLKYIQEEHEHLKKLAIVKGDLATATRNMELLGKTIAAYTERTESMQVSFDGNRPTLDSVSDSRNRIRSVASNIIDSDVKPLLPSTNDNNS